MPNLPRSYRRWISFRRRGGTAAVDAGVGHRVTCLSQAVGSGRLHEPALLFGEPFVPVDHEIPASDIRRCVMGIKAVGQLFGKLRAAGNSRRLQGLEPAENPRTAHSSGDASAPEGPVADGVKASICCPCRRSWQPPPYRPCSLVRPTSPAANIAGSTRPAVLALPYSPLVGVGLDELLIDDQDRPSGRRFRGEYRLGEVPAGLLSVLPRLRRCRSIRMSAMITPACPSTVFLRIVPHRDHVAPRNRRRPITAPRSPITQSSATSGLRDFT